MFRILAKVIRNITMLVSLPLLLSSCIYDNYDVEEAGATNGEPVYMSVAFVFADNVSGTRSEWDQSKEDKTGYFFNQGIAEESRICTDRDVNWLMAYDDNGAYLGAFPLINVKEEGSNNAGTNFVAVCEVTGREEEVKKAKNLRIVLNANSTLGLSIKNGTAAGLNMVNQEGTNVNDFIFHVDGDGVTYHTMTSSMVVEGGEAVPVSKLDEGGLKIYPSIYEARENPSATLYVERLQSKYTVLFHPSADGKDQYFDRGGVYDYDNGMSSGANSNLIVFSPTPQTTDDGVTLTTKVYYVDEFDINDRIPETFLGEWKASIVGWGINGTESSEYIYKQPGDASSNYTPYGFPYPVRNLWAIDPHYGEAIPYPDQYREAKDEPAVDSYEKSPGVYNLNYLSFNNLANRSIRHYSAENTFKPGLLTEEQIKDRAQYRCGNTLLIGAQLLIKGLDEEDVFTPTQVDSKGLIVSDAGNRVKTKYYMDNIYWSENAYKNYFSKYLSYNLASRVEIENNMTLEYPGGFVPKTVFNPADNENVFYIQDEGEWRIADYRDFVIKPLYIKGGDGWALPYPKLDNTDNRKTLLHVKQAVYDEQDSEKVVGYKYRQITLNEFEIFAYGYPVYFSRCYNEGRMYYAEPITDQNRVLGAVRNHWYHYEFNSLKNVGISVHDPEQPIIPTVEHSPIGFGFEVQIIPWHIVEEDVNI